jgi:hypothetical protein
MLGDPGLTILLAVQLALSLIAMWAWISVWRERSLTVSRFAAAASAVWFAMFAALIAYVFDVGFLP